MVVASFVTTNELGNKLILRSTTIMPNLPGLPALVCLMFAPMVELRKNEARTKLTGALCGLGVHPETGHSLFPENDIEIIFDVDFDLDDIREINRIRFWLNKAVCFSNKASDEEAEEEMRNCKDKLIEYISGLVFLCKILAYAELRSTKTKKISCFGFSFPQDIWKALRASRTEFLFESVPVGSNWGRPFTKSLYR